MIKRLKALITRKYYFRPCISRKLVRGLFPTDIPDLHKRRALQLNPRLLRGWWPLFISRENLQHEARYTSKMWSFGNGYGMSVETLRRWGAR